MYNTTDFYGQQTGWHSEGAGSSLDKFSLQLSHAPSKIKKKWQLSSHSSGGHTAWGLKSCLSSCAPVIMALTLGCVILLWIIALITDGPDEMRNCVVLWPIVAGVVAIAILFVVLRCVEFCLKSGAKQKNQKTIKEPLGKKDSLRVPRRQGSSAECSTTDLEIDDKHISIVIAYIFLAFALFCVMIGSVIQFYTLDSSCYHHLEETVSELLLGYEVLAYTSVVILSVIGCVMVCSCLGIIIRCLTRDIIDDTTCK